jgi:acyl-coenzyme A thioesterase PaaI-like protein
MIASFLAEVPTGSIGLDSGAGNGKYIPCARASGAEMIPMERDRGEFAIQLTGYLAQGGGTIHGGG